jgi:hypothetical protein
MQDAGYRAMRNTEIAGDLRKYAPVVHHPEAFFIALRF